MHSLLLAPTDVLFFRDGRPMGGASSGHGAAWPLPTVTNAALHAALHRADLQGVHRHVPGRSSIPRDYSEQIRSEKGRVFGDLRTAGPFPVCTQGDDHTWFFPRPADADNSGQPILLPHLPSDTFPSSLPLPCRYPVLSTKPPTKDTPKPWWSEGAWNVYLGSPQRHTLAARPFFKKDNEFADTEHTYGIGLDPSTGTVEEGRFYSASYLRLREHWRLGVLAACADKDFRHPVHGADLIRTLLTGGDSGILVGGQQRHCTARFDPKATARLPLPLGATITGTRVKWVLLTPAIFPAIPDKTADGRPMTPHNGGWLPNWVTEREQSFEGESVPAGSVLLLDGLGKEKARRKHLPPGQPIRARLVAALVGKPVPVTGYALPHEIADRADGGAKPTHLAVPAGAVYYFEAHSEPDAQKLAASLNWHGGDATGTTIRNRRSTLLGEKGFGLGVCGTWTPHPGAPTSPSA